MQRILEPGAIEAFAQRDIPRLRLPDRALLFVARASRLRQLAQTATGTVIGDYLRLMAGVADTQHIALSALAPEMPSPAEIARAQEHGMPLVHATSWPRKESWRDALRQICDHVVMQPDVPGSVRVVTERLSRAPPGQLEMEAEALLAANGAIDAAAAPFVMAALQVCWVNIASRLATQDVASLDVATVCPVCGTMPVASIVRIDPRSQGFRYLHCALCAAEWHMVRVTCSHCQGTKGISYQSIEGGSPAIRAECCDSCRTYRKIFHQEHDGAVEPVADDLASLALDLLLSEAGYHRTSGNPLLWSQPTS
jgi:FdhE protein